MVGTWISTSGKDPGGICSDRRSLMKTNPFAFPPREPEPICVQQNVPSQNFRSKLGNSATSGFRLVIGLSHPIIEDAGGLPCTEHRSVAVPGIRLVYTQPRSWQARATRPMAMA